MPDEELINELLDRSNTVGVDLRFLIEELIKRYKILKFEILIHTKKGADRNEG